MLPVKAEIKAELSEENQKTIIKGAARALEPFGIGASLISDQLAYYRLECLVNIVNKATELCKKNNIDPKLISKKFLARFVEEASYEDGEELQNMWACLLANASQNSEDFHFIGILKILNLEDVLLLKEIYERINEEPNLRYYRSVEKYEKVSRVGGGISHSQFHNAPWCVRICVPDEKGALDNENEKRLLSAQKLHMHGLIELNSLLDMQIKGRKQAVVWATANLQGYNFFNACSGEKND